MIEQNLSPDDAARALAEVAERRRQVAKAARLYPAWYFLVAGILVAAGIWWMDFVGSPWFTVGAVVIGMGQGAVGLAAIRGQRVKPHASLYGVRGVLVVAAFFATAIVVTSCVAGFAAFKGAPPIAIGLAGGASFALVGLLLQVVLRRVFLSRAARVGR